MAKRLLIQSVSRYLLCSLLAAGLLLSGCRNKGNEDVLTGESIHIGLMAPMTGHHEEWVGRQMVNSARMAVQAINDAGGLLVGDRRHFIILVVANDTNNPETAVSAAQRLINQAQVVAIVGPPFDNTAVPVATVAERAGIPMISPTSVHPGTTAHKQYVFRATFTEAVEAAAVARFVAEESDFARAAVLYDAGVAENQRMAELFTTSFARAGGHVTASEGYTRENGQTINLALTRIGESGAEFLFLPGAGQNLLWQAQQVRETALNISLLGSNLWESEHLYAEPAFEGAYFSNHFCPKQMPESYAAFSQQYAATYGQEPGSLAALTYDALGLLFYAIQSKSEIDPDSIRQALYNSRYIGVTGPFFFDDNGNPKRDVAIWRIAQGTAACVLVVNGDDPGNQ
jgi:branched-chain amino acid transport system substrate-binding protein